MLYPTLWSSSSVMHRAAIKIRHVVATHYRAETHPGRTPKSTLWSVRLCWGGTVADGGVRVRSACGQIDDALAFSVRLLGNLRAVAIIPCADGLAEGFDGMDTACDHGRQP